MSAPKLRLNDYSYADLFKPHQLKQLDQQFLNHLAAVNSTLYDQLLAYRGPDSTLASKEISELCIACGPILESFIAQLFDIGNEVAAQQLLTLSHDPIFVFKKWYVLREAKRFVHQEKILQPFVEIEAAVHAALQQHGLDDADLELAISRLGQLYLEDQLQNQQGIDQLVQWCVHALQTSEAQAMVSGWVSFKLPRRLDYQQLVQMTPIENDAMGRYQSPQHKLRQRDGFQLTDERMNTREVLNEIHYCVYCHKNDGDFCSKGFPVKKTEPEKGLKTNALDEVMTGCPLEEKISEMHVLKKAGHSIGALAVIMIDNPMCPATGHRICNDCMKACIYQKQDPVNIPQAETNVLTDVLDLPWGVEIYDLFTRWNPLRQDQWVIKPYNGLKVLIMGMGPAGFTLAHHLLMEGFAVVGTDGLKIEPIDQSLIDKPIHRFEHIKERLDERVMAGFGGVAEYGITVRWDKNFLKLIYICLLRRQHFQVYGGVRFGGSLTVDDAWDLGFDHMAIAVGAGLPRELPIPGSMAPGMRQANDFLMALQLTGAAKKNSLANLQVRLPAVIIGGGLTGIDAATEVQAYYIAQVEKTLERYETLTKSLGEARVREQFSETNFTILDEFLTHGRQVRLEREIAASELREPDFIRLLHKWGGSTVVYRGLIQGSPAYKRNHEEIDKALEEGIFYAEGLEPKAARLNTDGHVEALVCRSRVYSDNGSFELSDEEVVIPAKSILVATGAKPNIAYEFEHRGTFHREGMEYQSYELNNGELEVVHHDHHIKAERFGAFTSYHKDDHLITFLGDTHPVFHGSVVKAIASAKRCYPKITAALHKKLQHAQGQELEYQRFKLQMKSAFLATVLAVKRHTPSVVEVCIHAPLAAKNYLPGQFYRVQNFETQAVCLGETKLQSEAMAMIGAKIDKQAGDISLMVLEKGASSRLFATLKPGDPISIMGPTGVRTKIPHNHETVMFVGGRMGAAHISSVGPAMREAGNRVLYIAGFQTAEEVYFHNELLSAADKILWITETGNPVVTRRKQDIAVTGNFMDVLLRYAQGEFGESELSLEAVDRVLVVGTQKLIRVFDEARKTSLQPHLIKTPLVIASVYGPMQCMLKGVCAQCLQWQIDPETGKRTKAVYTCSWQDQPLEMVDIDNLDERLAQNQCQEILTNLWLDHLFASYNVPRV